MGLTTQLRVALILPGAVLTQITPVGVGWLARLMSRRKRQGSDGTRQQA